MDDFVTQVAASGTRRAASRQKKRDKIIVTASDHFNRKGFFATSLDEVAMDVGISKASIYYYFETKAELLLQCYMRTLSACETLLAEAQSLEANTLDQFCHFGRNLIILNCSSGTVAVLNEIDGLPPHAIEPIRDRTATLNHRLYAMFERGIKEGSIKPELQKVVGLFILGGINWLPKWHRPNGVLSPVEIGDAFVAFVRAGLQN